MQLEATLELRWGYTGAVVGLHWSYGATTLGLLWGRNGAVMTRTASGRTQYYGEPRVRTGSLEPHWGSWWAHNGAVMTHAASGRTLNYGEPRARTGSLEPHWGSWWARSTESPKNHHNLNTKKSNATTENLLGLGFFVFDI